jgi:protein-S-isoprenylcysteine O-methyltransferase Ste14
LAVGAAAYMLMAIRWKEADLVAMHGDKYRRYREQAPMIVPSISGR